MSREVIDVPGLNPGGPIPLGVRLGNIVFSSAISGRDPETHQTPEDPEAQAALMFQNLQRFMAAAGGTLANIGHVTVYMDGDTHREAFSRAWVKAFPNEAERPTRHIVPMPVRHGALFQVEVVAVV